MKILREEGGPPRKEREWKREIVCNKHPTGFVTDVTSAEKLPLKPTPQTHSDLPITCYQRTLYFFII